MCRIHSCRPCRTGGSGGYATTTAAALLDPKAVPEAHTLQIFLIFFVTFAMATMALIHTVVVERVRPMALYIMSFVVGAVLPPLVGYLCWGSVSPLSNRGVHDFDGISPLYIFAGTWVPGVADRSSPRRVPAAPERSAPDCASSRLRRLPAP